jgi:hypothetical protein
MFEKVVKSQAAKVNSSSAVFRAVADAARRGMLDRLAVEDLPVTELDQSFHISLPA